MTDPLIAITNLSKVYPMGQTTVQALRGISLTIHRGEFVALMGPSGSGKTTLLHLLGCLDRPSTGQYRLAGQELSTLSVTERAEMRNRHIGFIFQSFNLLPRLTALENVCLPLLYRAQAGHVSEQGMAVLEQVGLADRATHRPTELSGGQQQRVAIARALVTDPSLILADEPTGNLDSQTGAEIMALLGALHTRGRTLVLVTHDQNLAAQAERILQLQDGLLL